MAHDPMTPVPLTARVGSGTAVLEPDGGDPPGWTLLIDGVAQSHVHPRHPGRLDMMYARIIASVVDAAAGPRRVLHLGAGAMTIARYIAAARPDSAQLVVERDRALVDFVRFGLPLPEDAPVTVRVDDARAAAESLPDNAFDLIIADIYQGARMPRSVAGTGFVAQMARLLAPEGLYLVNVLDVAGLVQTRRQLATVRTGFADTAVLTTPAMWKGRRDGNVVIAAAAEPGAVPTGRIARAAVKRMTLTVRSGPELDRFLSGTVPLTG